MLTIAEKIDILEEAREMMEEALEIIRVVADEEPNFRAYVYDQIMEHVNNDNPYNQSINSVLQELYERSN